MRTPQGGTPLAPSPDPGAKPGWAMSPREADQTRRAGERAPRGPRRWPWMALALVLALAGALAWPYRDVLASRFGGDAPVAGAADGAGAAGGDEAPDSPIQINDDEWAIVEPQTLRRTVKVVGSLAPARRVDLAAQTAGQVETVAARPGDRVAAGDVLVQVGVDRLALDLDLARSNAASSRTQLTLAEGQLVRAQALVDRGVSAASSLDEASSAVEAERASLAALEDQVAAAELALADATVTAPFDGIVSAREVEPGAVVAAGAPLLTVVDLSEVEMLASAPVAAGASIRPGQAVEVAVDGLSGRVFEGEVVRIAPVAAEGTRTIVVYVTLGNADGTLLGGMFATGRIVVAEARDAVALPAQAIREDDAGAHVLVIEEGRIARRAVEVGEAWEGGLTQVAGGLAPGEAALVAELEDLAPGSAVELVEF